MLKSDRFNLIMLILFLVLIFLISPFCYPPELLLPYAVFGECFLGFVFWLTWGTGFDAVQNSSDSPPKEEN